MRDKLVKEPSFLPTRAFSTPSHIFSEMPLATFLLMRCFSMASSTGLRSSFSIVLDPVSRLNQLDIPLLLDPPSFWSPAPAPPADVALRVFNRDFSSARAIMSSSSSSSPSRSALPPASRSATSYMPSLPREPIASCEISSASLALEGVECPVPAAEDDEEGGGGAEKSRAAMSDSVMLA